MPEARVLWWSACQFHLVAGEVQDALHWLSGLDDCGATRQPVSVLATAPSPCFLDLCKDYPEEIVMAHKVGQAAYSTSCSSTGWTTAWRLWGMRRLGCEACP